METGSRLASMAYNTTQLQLQIWKLQGRNKKYIISSSTNCLLPTYICKSITHLLDNYFNPTKCYSKEEMEMAKSIFATFYQITMIGVEKMIMQSKNILSKGNETEKLMTFLAIKDFKVSMRSLLLK